MLRDEIEIQWAERRAFWLSQPEEFDHRLVSVDPLVLYRATLNAVLEKYENLHHYDPQRSDMMHYLHTRITRLDKAGLKTIPKSRLEDIL